MKRPTLLRTLATIFVSIGLVFVISGCTKKPAETATVEEPAVSQKQEVTTVTKEQPVEKKEPVIAESPAQEEKAPVLQFHVVKKGECLWWIAEYEDIYNDPFMWPLIYNANKDKITNPNLIYPGQKFSIPRIGYTMEEIEESRRSAGAPRPYTPPEGTLIPIK